MCGRLGLFRHDLDAVIVDLLGDLGMAGVLRAKDDDIEPLGGEKFTIVLIAARIARERKRPSEICLATALDSRQRRHPRHGVGARDDRRTPGCGKSVDEFVHVHVGKTDDANPIRLSLRSVHLAILRENTVRANVAARA